MPFVSPTDEATTTLTASGMARRLGTEVKKSWALAHVHIAYIDQHLQVLYAQASDLNTCHDIACAGAVNLLAYLGWLRSRETFEMATDSVNLIAPVDGPTRNLSPNIGAIEFRLLAATKSDPTVTADCVVAWTCLSGLSLGQWMLIQSMGPVRSCRYYFVLYVTRRTAAGVYCRKEREATGYWI
jgi:hypothetical protein